MNDESRITDEQLRQATSRSLPVDARLDSETALLRDGFLAFGGALQAAGGDFDETKLVEKLRAGGCGPSSELRLANLVLPKPAAVSSRWPALLIGAALAASVLIALGRLIVVSPGPEKPDEVVVAPAAPVQVDRAPDEQFVPHASPSSQVATAWVDPLDDEIAFAQAEMQWLTSRGYGLDGSLSQVGWQLEALSQELGGGSL